MAGIAAGDDTGGTVVDFDLSGEPLRIGGDVQHVDVRCNSMAPTVFHNQKALLAPQGRRDPRDDDMVAVKLKDGRSFIKHYWEFDDRIVLTSLNPVAREKPVMVKPDEIERLQVVLGIWMEGP